MKRITFIVITSIIVIAAAFLLWPRVTRLVSELRALPEVAAVEYTGTGSSGLVVLHLRDWHFVPEDFARLEGIDHAEHLADVEKVQGDQLAILRHLITGHGVKEVYIEGLSQETAPDFRLRVHTLRTMAKAEKATGKPLEGKEAALRRLLRLEAGAVARLLEQGEINNALPLEDEAALQAAKPVKDGKIAFDADAIQARHRAMVRQLPAEGLAAIVLGGSHDLRDVLPEGALYVRVTPRAYPSR